MFGHNRKDLIPQPPREINRLLGPACVHCVQADSVFGRNIARGKGLHGKVALFFERATLRVLGLFSHEQLPSLGSWRRFGHFGFGLFQFSLEPGDIAGFGGVVDGDFVLDLAHWTCRGLVPHL